MNRDPEIVYWRDDDDPSVATPLAGPKITITDITDPEQEYLTTFSQAEWDRWHPENKGREARLTFRLGSPIHLARMAALRPIKAARIAQIAAEEAARLERERAAAEQRTAAAEQERRLRAEYNRKYQEKRKRAKAARERRVARERAQAAAYTPILGIIAQMRAISLFSGEFPYRGRFTGESAVRRFVWDRLGMIGETAPATAECDPRPDC